jgi:hypothetical protein
MQLRRAFAWAALLSPLAARASFLSGETLDTAANWLSWFVIFLVPVVGITAFLFVHVLPEKIAEKRHHPHKDSIKVLCILSLFFGGMLWPFAWLWAYTKPVGYKAIYGTEKHESWFLEQGELALAGKLSPQQLADLRSELAAMQAKGALPAELRVLAEGLDLLPTPLPVRASVRPAEAITGGTR